MSQAILYRAGRPACVVAEQMLVDALNQSKY